MTLLKDLIDIPEHIDKGKFVLPLNEGLTTPQATVAAYVSSPYFEGENGTQVICGAGYDHLQQAQAISAYYVRVQTEFGGSDDLRLIRLLACLIELVTMSLWHYSATLCHFATMIEIGNSNVY